MPILSFIVAAAALAAAEPVANPTVAGAVSGGRGQVFGALSAADLAQSADTLESLYPSHDAFVTRFAAAADALVRDLYWLKPEADEAKRAAEQSHVGR